MSDLTWQLLDEELVHDGFVRVVHRRYLMPDGSTAQWDVVGGGRSVAVLACTVAGRYLLARQYRAGPGRVLDELPGGGVEPGESLEAAAARELEEETGWVAGELRIVGRAWQSASSRLDQWVAVATGCTPTGTPDPDPEEFIEVRVVTVAELVDVVRRGEMTDVGLAYRALDALGLMGPQGDPPEKQMRDLRLDGPARGQDAPDTRPT